MMLQKFIGDVVPGDVIVEGSNRTTVRKVDTETCKHNVHINDKDCWSNASEVRVQTA